MTGPDEQQRKRDLAERASTEVRVLEGCLDRLIEQFRETRSMHPDEDPVLVSAAFNNRVREAFHAGALAAFVTILVGREADRLDGLPDVTS